MMLHMINAILNFAIKQESNQLIINFYIISLFECQLFPKKEQIVAKLTKQRLNSINSNINPIYLYNILYKMKLIQILFKVTTLLYIVSALTYTHREGGLSSIRLIDIIKYNKWLSSQKNMSWDPTITALSQIISKNPIIKMNWEYGIYQSNKTLYSMTTRQVLDLMNKALLTPPAYSNSPLIGFPINSILVEFMQTEGGRNFFSQKQVNDAFHNILNRYGQKLSQPTSTMYLNDKQPNGWFSPSASKKINYSEYEMNKNLPNYGFKNWNQWFLRKFKNIQVTRPINAGAPQGVKDEDIIVNACESTPLTNPFQPVFLIQYKDAFWLKDNRYSLIDMLGDQKLAQKYTAGTAYQAFLSAMYYHRWHAPVSGTITKIYNIPGSYFLDHSLTNDIFDPSSPDQSQSFLSQVATRQIFLIQADNIKLGTIAIVFIGMAEASSCVATVKEGSHVQKGEEIGHFQFGGSTHLMLFQRKIVLSFNKKLYKNQQQNSGILQNVRSYLAHQQSFGGQNN